MSAVPPQRSYLVCATPRSGSTLLCEALTNTGLAGYPKEYFEALKATGLPRRPREYFEPEFLEKQDLFTLLGEYSWAEDNPPLHVPSPNYADYLANVFTEGTTSNGIFGAKMMWGYFDDFINYVREIPRYKTLETARLLDAIFPDLHYVFVIRRDKVRQAVSLWRALQTKTWREEETPSDGVLSTNEEPRFHFEAIDYLIQRNVSHEAAWRHYFQQHGIQPCYVEYEELAQAYEETALKILHYLHIPVPQDIRFAARRMKRQSDTLSEEWAQRYLALKREQEK